MEMLCQNQVVLWDLRSAEVVERSFVKAQQKCEDASAVDRGSMTLLRSTIEELTHVAASCALRYVYQMQCRQVAEWSRKIPCRARRLAPDIV